MKDKRKRIGNEEATKRELGKDSLYTKMSKLKIEKYVIPKHQRKNDLMVLRLVKLKQCRHGI